MSQVRSHSPLGSAFRVVIVAAVALLVLASALPMADTDLWWIRFLDFVRVQVAVALAVLLLIHMIAGGWRGRFGMVVAVAGVAALGYQAYRLLPYAPMMPPMAVSAGSCPEQARLAVMVANVQRTDSRAQELLALAAKVEPDVLVVLETTPWWDEQLSALQPMMPYHVQHIPADARYYGMHLYARYPLSEAEARFYFDTETPTIVASIDVPGIGPVQLIGLHPRPPHYWGQPSTSRDGHLVAAALEAAESPAPSILAGDFNAVPWERTVRRAMRIGELLDPRVGRGIRPTFMAGSVLVSWPLDQVLFEDGFGLVDFRVLPSFGSDHYPILATLCRDPAFADLQAAPPMQPGDLEEAERPLEAARRLRPGPG